MFLFFMLVQNWTHVYGRFVSLNDCITKLLKLTYSPESPLISKGCNSVVFLTTSHTESCSVVCHTRWQLFS